MAFFHNILKSYSFCSGSAEAPTPLNCFDAALLDAGIGNTNLVKISSILPPGCREITLPEVIPAGILLPAAWVSHNSRNSEEIIAAAVAVAIPNDSSLAGVIMEQAGSGNAAEMEKLVYNQARAAMQIRGIAQFSISCISVTHTVVSCGTVFAAIVLHN